MDTKVPISCVDLGKKRGFSVLWKWRMGKWRPRKIGKEIWVEDYGNGFRRGFEVAREAFDKEIEAIRAEYERKAKEFLTLGKQEWEYVCICCGSKNWGLGDIETGEHICIQCLIRAAKHAHG